MAKYYRVGLYETPATSMKLKDIKESKKCADIIVQDEQTHAKEIITKLRFPIYSSNDKVGNSKDEYYVRDCELTDENIVSPAELSNYVNRINNEPCTVPKGPKVYKK